MRHQWEDDFIEKPFYEQLELIGWQRLVEDIDIPELTDLLTGRIPEGITVAP